MGIKDFATLSDGTKISNNKFLKKSEKVIRYRSQKLAKKKRGSNNRKKAKILLAKAYLKVRNQRLDFARKLAKDLISRYDLIAIEKLNLKNMICDIKNINKSLNDVAWRMFTQCLSNKAEEAGKIVIEVDPTNTTKKCHRCGNIVEKDIGNRVHRCDKCGLEMDRDENAAINILDLGMKRYQTKDRLAEARVA